MTEDELKLFDEISREEYIAYDKLYYRIIARLRGKIHPIKIKGTITNDQETDN